MKRNTFGGPASSLVESNWWPVIFDQAAKSGLEAGSVARISRTWPTPTSLIALLALTTGIGQRSPLVSSVLTTASGIASLLSQRWRAPADVAEFASLLGLLGDAQIRLGRLPTLRE